MEAPLRCFRIVAAGAGRGSGRVMHDRLLSLLDEVETARIELIETLDRVGANLEVRRDVADPGYRLSEQDPVPGIELHEELIGRLERMHHSVAAARAESVRIMVDEEGLTLSDVAKLMGRPRQLVSRLYRSATETRSSG
jgi:hypothetical protein